MPRYKSDPHVYEKIQHKDLSWTVYEKHRVHITFNMVIWEGDRVAMERVQEESKYDKNM